MELAACIVVSVAVIATCSYLVISRLNNLGSQVGALVILETRVNLMADQHSEEVLKIWKYLMQRAETEVVTTGFGRRNSPLTIDKEKARPYYAKFIGKLRQFYADLGQHMSEPELFAAISTEFAEYLQTEVCIPLGFTSGGCVLMAMDLAKEGNEPLDKVKETEALG